MEMTAEVKKRRKLEQFSWKIWGALRDSRHSADSERYCKWIMTEILERATEEICDKLIASEALVHEQRGELTKLNRRYNRLKKESDKHKADTKTLLTFCQDALKDSVRLLTAADCPHTKQTKALEEVGISLEKMKPKKSPKQKGKKNGKEEKDN